MLAASPSPRIRPSSHLELVATSPARPQHDNLRRKRSTVDSRPGLTPSDATGKYLLSPSTTFRKPARRFSTRSLDGGSPFMPPRRKMVDAGTQYSPPNQSGSPSTKTPTAKIAGLQLTEKDNVRCIANEMPSVPKQSHAPAAPKAALADGTAKGPATTPSKRQAVDSITSTPPATNGLDIPRKGSAEPLQSKRARPEAPAVRFLPAQYENCNTRDLVILISSMLMELIRYNDAIPLREGHLTRFHSRAPPAISVLDYLQRLTTHATLSPPILLSMVYYIDRLCALYPAFTISSLTVHRFLIVSATVASKGLSDSFWTNKTYARVGGVSMKELALLELEFLTRMDWRIVPKPEVLCDYYRSLIERSSQYELER